MSFFLGIAFGAQAGNRNSSKDSLESASQDFPTSVIPAKAGIQNLKSSERLDPRLRGGDEQKRGFGEVSEKAQEFKTDRFQKDQQEQKQFGYEQPKRAELKEQVRTQERFEQDNFQRREKELAQEQQRQKEQTKAAQTTQASKQDGEIAAAAAAMGELYAKASQELRDRWAKEFPERMRDYDKETPQEQLKIKQEILQRMADGVAGQEIVKRDSPRLAKESGQQPAKEQAQPAPAVAPRDLEPPGGKELGTTPPAPRQDSAPTKEKEDHAQVPPAASQEQRAANTQEDENMAAMREAYEKSTPEMRERWAEVARELMKNYDKAAPEEKVKIMRQIRERMEKDVAEAKSTIKDQVKEELKREIRDDDKSQYLEDRASSELKVTEYQLSKSLVDVYGKRVRIEQYIVQPAPNSVQFFNLTKRDNRLDQANFLTEFKYPINTLGEFRRYASMEYSAEQPKNWLTGSRFTIQNSDGDTMEQASFYGDPIQFSYFDIPSCYDIGCRAPAVEKKAWMSRSYVAQLRLFKVQSTSLSQDTNAQGSQNYDVIKERSEFTMDKNNNGNFSEGASDWDSKFYVSGASGQKHPTLGSRYPNLKLVAKPEDMPKMVDMTMPSGPNAQHFKSAKLYPDGTRVTNEMAVIDNKGRPLPYIAYMPPNATADSSAQATQPKKSVDWNIDFRFSASEFRGREIDIVVDPKVLMGKNQYTPMGPQMVGVCHSN